MPKMIIPMKNWGSLQKVSNGKNLGENTFFIALKYGKQPENTHGILLALFIYRSKCNNKQYFIWKINHIS